MVMESGGLITAGEAERGVLISRIGNAGRIARNNTLFAGVQDDTAGEVAPAPRLFSSAIRFVSTARGLHRGRGREIRHGSRRFVITATGAAA